MERKRYSTLVQKECTATIALLPLPANQGQLQLPRGLVRPPYKSMKPSELHPLLWNSSELEKLTGAAINYVLPLLLPGLQPAGWEDGISMFS